MSVIDRTATGTTAGYSRHIEAGEPACWGADSEIFLLEPHQSADPAREICATCTVTDDCLNYAIRNRITVGVWGGKTLKERQRLTRQRKDLLL